MKRRHFLVGLLLVPFTKVLAKYRLTKNDICFRSFEIKAIRDDERLEWPRYYGFYDERLFPVVIIENLKVEPEDHLLFLVPTNKDHGLIDFGKRYGYGRLVSIKWNQQPDHVRFVALVEFNINYPESKELKVDTSQLNWKPVELNDVKSVDVDGHVVQNFSSWKI